ncbi:response regulator transcription factor [Paenibacillus sp. MY03]|uniref:response regulator transcription factor n=1 Tax=Paenibacillus sp. MY03 TaxID=302980 RepID=UPI0011809A3C|nr:response regulator transcription factor [Paenibacillus sp. MY03]
MVLEANIQRECPMISKNSNENINVVLVDRDLEWCCRFANLLETERDIHLINTSATKEEAVRASLQLDVDVVVVNATLQSSGRDGLDATKDILAERDVPVIAVASSADPEVIVEAITVGAVNFISKADIQDIIMAIREAYRHRPSLHPKASRVLREEFIRLKRQEFWCKLTATEKEVLQLIAWGYSQSKLIQLMGISPNTMKTPIRHISRKLGTKSIKEAAVKARRVGLEKHMDNKENDA